MYNLVLDYLCNELSWFISTHSKDLIFVHGHLQGCNELMHMFEISILLSQCCCRRHIFQVNRQCFFTLKRVVRKKKRLVKWTQLTKSGWGLLYIIIYYVIHNYDIKHKAGFLDKKLWTKISKRKRKTLTIILLYQFASKVLNNVSLWRLTKQSDLLLRRREIITTRSTQVSNHWKIY